MHDFTRASALMGYAEQAREYGLQPKAMMRAAGLPTDILAEPDGLISYRQFLKLLEASATQSSDPLFGLKLGLRQGISIFGPILYVLRNADSVGAALNELQQYFHLHMGAAVVETTSDGQHFLLAYKVADPVQAGISQGVELAMGVGIKLLHTLLGRQWQPVAMMLEHRALSAPASYRKVLGFTPRFEADANALLIRMEDLQRPLSQADPVLHRLMQQHLASLQGLSELTLPAHVQGLLRNFLPQGRVTVEQLAASMVMSPRTLQRRLGEAGTSFQTVLDDTRRAMAQRYLRDSTLSMTELTSLLGYADLSTFTRAFTRWFGMPPSQWRAESSQ
ncbi:MAG: AraC family transcriptional regulator [Pedobacter sp.]|nr:AraC family transcriptional regulator [Pedobacter sp.]